MGESQPFAHSSRREIDVAVGVLMGVRRCTEREAFDTIMGAVQATRVGLGEVSRSLIAVVGGADSTLDSPAIKYWTNAIG